MNIEIKDFEKDRVVHLSGEIDGDSLLQLKKDFRKILSSDNAVLVENCRELSKLGDIFVETYKKTTQRPSITLDITSPGGKVYHALAMYDFLKGVISSGVNVECVATGLVASAATIVMLACDKRYAMGNTSFMVHSLSGITYGKLEDLKDDIEECLRLNTIISNIYTSRTDITSEKLKEVEVMKKDWWMDADEALRLRLVTDKKL